VAAGVPTVSVLDGAKDTDNNVGRFASLAKSPLVGGEYGIAYDDATASSLKYWHGVAFGDAGAKIEVVITGVSPGEKDYDGANCSLAFDATGKARIAFQDATKLTLVYAIRGEDADPWPAANFTTLLDPAKDVDFGKGGFGFFINQILQPDGVYISNVKIGFKTKFETTIPDTRMILLKRPL